MSRSDFQIFDNIIDGTDLKAKLKWAERYRRAIVEKIDPKTGRNLYQDGYFDILLEEYAHVDSRRFDFTRRAGHDYRCVANYYQSKDHCIAQVATYPREVTSVAGDPLTTKEKGEIGIATYCKNDNDEVVIINRFDAVGFAKHANDYTIYDPTVAPTYEKYFTDGYEAYAAPGGGYVTKPFASVPHFHFQSPTQTLARGQEACNAISIDKLLVYLYDLQNGLDQTIQHESLGMPFLSYFKNERTYNSTMEQYLVQARDALIEKGDSCDIPIINYMQHMIDICQDHDDGGGNIIEEDLESFVTTQEPLRKTYTSNTFPFYNYFEVNGVPSFIPVVGTPEGFDNIRAIEKDLTVAKYVIEHCQEYPELIAGISNIFIESLNAPQKLPNGEGNQVEIHQ